MQSCPGEGKRQQQRGWQAPVSCWCSAGFNRFHYKNVEILGFILTTCKISKDLYVFPRPCYSSPQTSLAYVGNGSSLHGCALEQLEPLFPPLTLGIPTCLPLLLLFYRSHSLHLVCILCHRLWQRLNNLLKVIIRNNKSISQYISLSLRGLFMVRVPVLDTLLPPEEQSDFLFYSLYSELQYVREKSNILYKTNSHSWG